MKKLAELGDAFRALVGIKKKDKIFNVFMPDFLEEKDKVVLDMLNKSSANVGESDSLDISEALELICKQENCTVEEMQSHKFKHIIHCRMSSHELIENHVWLDDQRNFDARQQVNESLKFHNRKMRLLPLDMEYYRRKEENQRKRNQEARQELHGK